ncbi:MAG: hypothetical protein JNL74_10290 [Fibrobacteres bacterium]|nr:hypothetical protein [Fibrobacterota bacterium]
MRFDWSEVERLAALPSFKIVRELEEMKTSWTWEEWMSSRATRKAIADKYGPPVTRRKESSSDRRLRKAFNGERAPIQK